MAKKTNTTNTKTSPSFDGPVTAGTVPEPPMHGGAFSQVQELGDMAAMERKLDRIIELLEAIAGSTKNIPFQGLNMHWLEGRGEG